MARWIERMQNYQFRIEHRKGQVHNNIAKIKKGGETCQQIHVNIPETLTERGLQEEQLNDEDLAPIIKWMEIVIKSDWQQISEHGEVTKSCWAQWDSLIMRKEILHRKWKTEDGTGDHPQIILPKSRITEVMKEFHKGTSGGHFGVSKTMEKVKERCRWLHYKSDVEEWCRNCNTCAANK